MIGHEFPYTNLHDVNIDWILRVVKEFNEKYHGIDDAIDAAIARLNATANELETAMQEYMQGLEEETTANINEIYARFQLEANEAIQAIISNKELALSAIDSEMNSKLAQVSTLLNSLPHDYQDALNSMQIINATLNGTNNYPELVQGHYADAQQSDSKTLVPDNYRVSSLLSAGCASRKLRTRVTNANGIIRDIIYWTGWGDSAVSHPVSVSTSATDEKTLFTYTFPADATYFTVVFASDYNMLNTIAPSDLQIDFQWIFDSLQTLEVDDETDISGNADGFILSNDGDILSSYTTGTEKSHMDVGHTTGTIRHYFKDAQARNDIAELNDTFDEKVNSKYGSEFSPNLIENDASMTMGYVAKNGSISSASDKAYTDYIPVEPGYVLRLYFTKQNVFTRKDFRFICCYDHNKNVISSAGSNTALDVFTVPEGVYFVRATFEGVVETGAQATSNYMLSVNSTPTAYTEYTPLKADITEDFLTQESEAFLTGLMANGISSKNITNKYGCALPQTKLFQTIGLPEKWYNDSMVTPPTMNIIVSAGLQYTSKSNDGISFLNTTALNSSNGYNWGMYDVFYALIKSGTGNSGLGWARRFITESLSDCSLLAIGDSTVDHDTMTATLLSHFTEQGHTLTLLGTLGDGSDTNKNEGRAGWSAQDYLTDRQYQGVTNPFYNPSTQTFDFSYYMSNQGYTGVDFVVLQLGINDLYNYDDTKIEPTWSAMETIIDSILAYNSGIKIILNLPTTPNSDQSQLNTAEFLYRNRVIRYNEYAMAQSLAKYGTTKVRCSYCHLILDSHTEIRDNVHPTVAGYQKMALEVINQINCWQAGV